MTIVMGGLAAVHGGTTQAQQQVWRFDESAIGGEQYPDVEFKILIYYWDPVTVHRLVFSETGELLNLPA